MADLHEIHDPAGVRSEASEWVVLLETSEGGPEARAEFARWLAAHPQNRRTFEQMSHLWRHLHALPESVVREALAAPEHPQAASGPSRVRLGALAGIAAVLVLAVGWQLLIVPSYQQVLRTALGQQQSFALPDGSRVQLNTSSLLEATYTRGERRFVLRRGEAHFEVVPDPHRPLLVRAGAATVRALGTAFNVYLKAAHQVEITVTEGTVEVSEGGEGAAGQVEPPQTAGAISEALTVTAGQRVEYQAGDAVVASLDSERLEQRFAWRHGMLLFRDESLAEVIAEVSRYTYTRLVVRDAQLAATRVSGYFKAGDVESLLEVLRNLDIEIERVGSALVYLTSATAPAEF